MAATHCPFNKKDGASLSVARGCAWLFPKFEVAASSSIVATPLLFGLSLLSFVLTDRTIFDEGAMRALHDKRVSDCLAGSHNSCSIAGAARLSSNHPRTSTAALCLDPIRTFLRMENKDNALTVLGSNTSAATFLASVSLTLSSLIGAWIANNSNIFRSSIIYGDTRPSTMSIKFISLLICFILAFSCFVQSARCFIHANYLVSISDSNIPINYVELPVIRGGEFWSLGLRALYFAIDLLLWFFGPIPMFATSVAMVVLLYYLDTNTTPLHNHRRLPAGKPAVGL
ncbi:uncharacterized protein LOC127795997 isoform X1 [Diospyros lotus]|uniref:uncharacterized protein LOC127795997 isoform X1 n=1 Tax=Diospyros lotus TaxID=55363 RepID=UPI0022583306|nr:uncharacterized protein LOC127795997 isoform X1 [Diospyros lotus]